jgi:hypothetical protein
VRDDSFKKKHARLKGRNYKNLGQRVSWPNVKHKHVKVGQLVILAQKIKVSEKYILKIWILGLLPML